MDICKETERPQDGWWQKAAGVAALAASLALTGCEANSGPIKIEPISPATSSLPLDNSTILRSELGVYQLDAENIATDVANFIAAHPELRILDIEGNGNGAHGRNSFYSLVTRPARSNESPQTVDVVHSNDPVQAAFRYRDLNPDREISAMAGDGNGSYGRNTYYVFVSTKPE